MVVLEQHINDWCGVAAKRMLTRGRNLYASNKVVSFQHDVEYGMLTGRVEASMRKISYIVWVKLNRKTGVEAAGCECVRGLSKCGHMVALLHQAKNSVSSTSMSCQWSKKKAPTDDKACTVRSLQKRKPFQPSYNDFDRTKFEALESDLKNCPDEAGAGVPFLLAKERDQPPAIPVTYHVPDAKSVICSGSTADANPREKIEDQMALSGEQIVKVADSTKGQSSNPEWVRVRFCRLTASNFGSILKKMDRKGGPAPSEAFLRSLSVHRNLDGVKSIQWGKTHEKVALKKFEEDGGLSVAGTGIWLHESGLLGASPGGLIGENGVVEVRCPYSCRKATKLAEALSGDNTKKNPYIVFQQDGVWKVNPDHQYYHQLQACLHFTKRYRGIFYIWTPKDCVSVFVEKDSEWGKNIPSLLSFYFDFFCAILYVRSQSNRTG